MGEVAKYALKISVLVGLLLTLSSAVFTVLSLISYATVNTHFGEVITLISLYLPFNANAVFTGFLAVISAVLSFLVADKIYNLLSNTQNKAS